MEEKRDNIKIITKILNIIIVLATMAIIVAAVYIVVTEGTKDKLISNKNYDEYLSKIEEAYKLLDKKYYGDIDLDEITEYAIAGLMQGVDDVYTRYITKEEYDEMLQGVNEEYTGLGIHINYDSETGGIIINNVMPNSPAEKQGLLPGDIFVKVGDIVCSSKTYYDCIDLIKTKEPTDVHIIYQRNGEILEGDFKTEIVTSNAVVSNILDENIGYIRLYSFDTDVSKEFKTQYQSLRDKNIKGLVIDLRNNPGGLVSEVCNILKMILPKGTIVKMVYKDGTEKAYTNSQDSKIDIPLVVLVNENSASGSEIFAGAVKDLDAGVIVGTKTYGKGIVQNVEKLELSEGALSITTSKYYTASGVEIHKNGIEPNVEIKAKEEYKNKWYIPFEEDLELKEAIKIINETEK